MRQKIYWLIPISVISLAISLAACGPTRPPNTGLEDAASGLDAARAAGASTYAPLEIRNAEERLSLARAAVDKRDYDTALQLSLESRVNSDLAVAKSHLGKAREKVEARTRENAQLQQDLSASGGDGNSGGGQP